jgi:hypothetical protein
MCLVGCGGGYQCIGVLLGFASLQVNEYEDDALNAFLNYIFVFLCVHSA